MEALIDTLLYLLIIGGAALVIGGLAYGIYRLVIRSKHVPETDKSRRIHENRQYMKKKMKQNDKPMRYLPVQKI